MNLRSFVLLSLLLTGTVGPASANPSSVTEHLLAGVRAFRAGRFDSALVEFRQVEQLGGASDLALYLGPTLYKLDRLQEARAVLAAYHRTGARDPVADYYLGLSYYRFGFLRLARETFLALDAHEAGPQLAEGARRFVAEIDRYATRGVDVSPLLTAAERLSNIEPSFALDVAEEAFLRAMPETPERKRAAALIGRFDAPILYDRVAHLARDEAASATLSR
jgi:tetratricopeptide (TPR) repeat protein